MMKKKVWVKLTGDGTNIGKRLHVVNFGFTILDEGNVAAGKHCITIFKEPETYQSLKAALHDIASDVKSLVTIDVNGTTFEVEYYLGGDWKFLALATGIDSASSKYACIWCKCPALERHISGNSGRCLTQLWELVRLKRTYGLPHHTPSSSMSLAFQFSPQSHYPV